MAASEPKRIRAPEPPKDLAERNLPIGAAPQDTWVRLHNRRFRNPLYWSREGKYRFDSVGAPFGVFYSGCDLATAFLEVFGDKIRHSRRLAAAAVERYDVCAVKTAPNLKVLTLAGANLAKIGATLGCFSGSYPLAQRWGAALMRHPDRIDGLVYLGRRSGARCLALFGDEGTRKNHQRSLAVSHVARLDELADFWQLTDELELAVY